MTPLPDFAARAHAIVGQINRLATDLFNAIDALEAPGADVFWPADCLEEARAAVLRAVGGPAAAERDACTAWAALNAAVASGDAPRRVRYAIGAALSTIAAAVGDAGYSVVGQGLAPDGEPRTLDEIGAPAAGGDA
ncbi:MAG: hypothetical protein IPL61_18735 [Myxococcales bacterium]|nr:hypothetical protein [Myxococcales bacterium]